MKIAILAAGGVDRSGTTRVIPCLLWLIERLVDAGDEVHVFALNQEPEPGRWTLRGASVHNVGKRTRWLRLARMLLAEHRRARFNVIHAIGGWPGAIAGVAGRLSGMPVAVTFVGGEVARHETIGYGARLRRSGRLAIRLAALFADAVTVQSHFMQRLAAEAGIATRRITLGVSTQDWPPAPPRQRSAGAPLRLIHVASLNRVKDQATLLEAMNCLRERRIAFELSVVGFDTLDGAVQRRATELGLDRSVRFHGFVPQAELRPMIASADLLVVSSRHEGGPLVFLEAAVLGVPTVGTEVGHISDLALDAALSVPPGEARSLADGIARLGVDEALRLRLAHAAQAFAVREDADFSARAFRQLYREIGAR